MSILNRTAPRVKPQTPVTATRVIFDASRKTRTPHFGAGVLPTTRYSNDFAFMPFTAEDHEWARGLFADEPSDAEIDAMYRESALLDRYTAGHVL